MALSDLFKKFKDNKEEDSSPLEPVLNLHTNSRVLLIDGLNTFLRSFSVTNTHNFSGNHVGGLTGFLMSIGSAIKQINPTKVIILFDGDQGSRSRKYLYPQYKANRLNNNKISNTKVFSTKEEEEGSKNDQIQRLISYLRTLPVTLIAVDRLEADDLIAELAKYTNNTYDDSFTYIMSSDGDFLQLVNSRTIVYSPTKKKFYYEKDVLLEYGVHPNNFDLYKTLVGDKSDNIAGVEGCGPKTVSKLFPALSLPEKLTTKDLYEVCENPPKKSVLYERVLFVKNLVEVTHQVVSLRNVNMMDTDRKEIIRLFEKKVLPLSKQNFLELWQEDRLHDAIRNVEKWLDLFAPLGRYKN